MITSYCNKIKRKSAKNFECKLANGHTGKCNSFPFLAHLKTTNSKIAKKIEQDAYHTRGNKTKPFKNRSFRWDNPISNNQASTMKTQKNKGIPKKEYATQEECFKVAQKLTRLVYEMENAPECPDEIKPYLDQVPDKVNNPCICPLCKEKLDIHSFGESQWGQAVIELWHTKPLNETTFEHNANNIAWGHRACNIAQNDKTLSETLDWFEEILKAHNRI